MTVAGPLREGAGRHGPTAPGVTLSGRAELQGRTLFGPLTLTLSAGRWTGLLGRSGVGKSTLLRLLAGLETGADFAGRIEADDGAPLAGRVAYMGQGDLLLPWADVRGNVMLGPRLRGERADPDRADDLIRRVGLEAHAHKRPDALSGGQRQRAALARTLMEDRAVVVLDEPFSALDAGIRAEMQELAGALLRGRTVLMVTHDPFEAARMSDAAFLMQAGGLDPIPLPAGPPVRPLDDPATMEAQAALLGRLRSAA